MSTPSAPIVALVEDDEQMMQAMQRVLEMAGYATQLFDSAETFLESGKACRAECLVVDVRLPGISGVELHQRLRAGGNRVPTVFVTAFDDWRRRGLELEGADACLVKPFPAETLVQAVSHTLGEAHAPSP
jgi:FixJ family two-component response regulator